MSELKTTMVRALRCLAIAVPTDVQMDVAAKVREYTEELEALNSALKAEVASLEVRCNYYSQAQEPIQKRCEEAERNWREIKDENERLREAIDKAFGASEVVRLAYIAGLADTHDAGEAIQLIGDTLGPIAEGDDPTPGPTTSTPETHGHPKT